MSKKSWIGLLFAVLLLAFGETFLRACPNCKDTVVDAAGTPTNGLAAGFNLSILTMLSVPYLLLAVGIFTVRRAILRAQAAKRAVMPTDAGSPDAVPSSVAAES